MTETINEQMAKTHTVTIQLSPDKSSYEFIKDGKAIQFAPLRSELDIRGGIGNRNTDYLRDQGVVRTDANGKQIVDITGLWEVFAKKHNPEGAYELLQGNTRYLLLQQCFQHNLDLLHAAEGLGTPEAMADFEAKSYSFNPVNFSILPEEIDPNNPEKHEYIIWRQSSSNNAVKPHTALQLALLGLQYMTEQFAKDALKPKAEREGKEAIRNRVAKVFGVVRSRTSHWDKIAKAQAFPNIIAALEQGTMILDAFVEMDIAVGKLQNLFTEKHPGLDPEANGVTLEAFYQKCLDRAITESVSKNGLVRIFISTVTSVRDEWMKQINPPVETIEGDDDFGPEGEGSETSGEGSTDDSGSGKVDPYKDMTELDLTTVIETALNNLMEFSVTNNDGDPMFDLADLRKMAAIVEGAVDKVSKFSTIDEKAAKAQQAEAEKVAKAEARKAEKEAQKVQQDLEKIGEGFDERKAEVDAAMGESHSEQPVTV